MKAIYSNADQQLIHNLKDVLEVYEDEFMYQCRQSNMSPEQVQIELYNNETRQKLISYIVNVHQTMIPVRYEV